MVADKVVLEELLAVPAHLLRGGHVHLRLEEEVPPRLGAPHPHGGARAQAQARYYRLGGGGRGGEGGGRGGEGGGRGGRRREFTSLSSVTCAGTTNWRGREVATCGQHGHFILFFITFFLALGWKVDFSFLLSLTDLPGLVSPGDPDPLGPRPLYH